jgi:hypothetical protein
MINDKELKFLQQTTEALIKAIGWDKKDEGIKEAYYNILNALINKYIDTVKNED